MPPAWEYNQEVRILTGKYAGQSGLLKHCREESRNHMRAEVETPIGRVWCDLEDLEGHEKYDAIGILLMLPEEEHPAFLQMNKDYQEGRTWS